MYCNYIPVYIQQSSLNDGLFIQMENVTSNKINYVKEMYPKSFSKILELIDEELDRLEYTGSFIYDEFLDKERLLIVRERIFEILNLSNSSCEDDMCMLYPEENWLKDIIMVLLLDEIARRS